MRSEILKLEGIINDQKDTIRTLKIKIAANEQSAYSNTGHASINVNQQNSIESRLRDLEFENIKRRLDILELTIQGRGAKTGISYRGTCGKWHKNKMHKLRMPAFSK